MAESCSNTQSLYSPLLPLCPCTNTLSPTLHTHIHAHTWHSFHNPLTRTNTPQTPTPIPDTFIPQSTSHPHTPHIYILIPLHFTPPHPNTPILLHPYTLTPQPPQTPRYTQNSPHWRPSLVSYRRRKRWAWARPATRAALSSPSTTTDRRTWGSRPPPTWASPRTSWIPRPVSDASEFGIRMVMTARQIFSVRDVIVLSI